MSGLLKVSSNPHIRSKVTTSSIMTAVVIALLPAAGFGIYNFGPRALAVMAVTSVDIDCDALRVGHAAARGGADPLYKMF